MSSQVVVRFAPSPTGTLHIGGLRTALFNWLWARKHHGTFILRIEDTDQTRLVPGAVDNIMQALEWYGLDVDHGPIFQSKRSNVYRQYADQLVADGRAYYSFETPERLEELRKIQRLQHVPIKYDALREGIDDDTAAERVGAGEAHVVRLKVPRTGTTSFHDEIYGDVQVQNADVDDQILLKSDGFPTYHLANVVDDHEMSVTHVIRAQEWLPSTPKHILLYQALGWQLPVFAHLPMVLGPDRSKLSKRHGAAAALEYRDQGFLPDAVLNFIALLGWNPKNDQEMFDRQSLINSFDLSKVNRASAIFNIEKLEWLNGAYIRSLPIDELVRCAHPFLGTYATKENIDQALELVRDRMRRLTELPAAIEFLYESLRYDPAILIPKKETKERTVNTLAETLGHVSELTSDMFTPEQLRSTFEHFISTHRYTNRQVLWPLRVALTGRTASPGVFEVMAFLGKEKATARIRQALENLKSA